MQNNQLDMYVAISNLNWTGVNADGVTANSSWDTTTTSTNWANLAPSSTTAAAYQDGSNVTFADKNALNNGAITTSNITIQSQGVQPNSITFDNNTLNYTFNNAAGGTVGIGGATGIVKSGSGAVYLQGANTFQGPVSINGGIINVANSAGLGVSSGVTVASGAALQLQGGVSLPSISLSLAGSLDSVSGANSYPGSVTLTAPAAIDATAGLLTLGGAVSNGGYALTIGGAGTTTMSGPGISGNGGLTVNAGATLNLAGTMSTSGSLIDNGSLNLAGAAGVNGTLLVAGTGSVSSANSLAVGFQSGGVGAAFQNGGAVTVTGAGSGLYVGVAGGTGAYNITAGTLSAGAGDYAHHRRPERQQRHGDVERQWRAGAGPRRLDGRQWPDDHQSQWRHPADPGMVGWDEHCGPQFEWRHAPSELQPGQLPCRHVFGQHQCLCRRGGDRYQRQQYLDLPAARRGGQ